MAKKHDALAIAAKKRTQLLERTALALDLEQAATRQLLALPRRQSIRINPLAGEPATIINAMCQLGWRGQQYAWLPEGYTAETGLEELRDSKLVETGQVFIQNAASWLPVVLLDVRPQEDVLDVCAAPGGKTTHMAARSSNLASITANDNSRGRLHKLQATCARLHADISQFTLYDAQYLARRLPEESYDKILLDAPCSGEGLIRYERDKDLETWSVAHIKRLQQLQRKLLVQAWKLLRPGGTLVYSTCTMAPEENEMVIDYALRRLDAVELVPIDIDLPNRRPAVTLWNSKQLDERLAGCLRLQPSPDIEAFFVAILHKPQTSATEAYG